jgi:nicotinate-nucleotide adenylyltransferase
MTDRLIGVLGGNFDPIHFGHLRTALDVMQGCDLAEVRFIPLHHAVHREQPVVPGEARLRMIQAAIASQTGFVADDRELQRQGSSYMVDTLASLHEEFSGRSLCLILGADAFNLFLSWRDPERILQLAHLIVMQRPGPVDVTDAALQQLLPQHRCRRVEELKHPAAGRIYFQPVTQLEISSTRIRALIAAGKSPRYLLPEGVLKLIEAAGFYSG